MIEQEARRLLDLAGVRPRIALILGSGLGQLAEAVEDAVVVSTSEIKGYPVSTVAGHRGRMVIGMLEDTPVIVLQGRAHLYEGHPIDAVGYPIRLLHALGAERLVVTNAAGGINSNYRPGTLMFIADHINFAGANPLAGRAEGAAGSGEARMAAGEQGERNASGDSVAFQEKGLRARSARTTTPYDEAWLASAERTALDLGIRADRGVYIWTRGPSYETKAEIRFFRSIGADAVGMSTVPEVIQASALGMKVLGISTITNPGAGLSAERLSHEEVLRVGQRAGRDLERLVRHILRNLR